ncbi:ATP-binding protein [Bifidobacterium eulemuris]|uniref:GHKL domain-containing protein n=1 Tax=Bifidobacterium eulemuris TaxID=1765219 RepID=A0A261G1H9_9BIFI|nr:ATP-binding protein [Bifidobacterium eulemuris]OZG65277.1 GHKL domain-containing protein [Bifidobacterium eulemuris]QOL32308.1 sensor histidine kinase [Bifidobacterium eulemuris]
MMWNSFVIELLCATAVFSGGIGWRRSWRLLAIPMAAVACAASMPLFLTPSEGFYAWNPDRVVTYHILCAIVVVVLIRCCARATWLESIIVVVLGYAVQHIVSDVVMVACFAAGWSVEESYSWGWGVPRLLVFAFAYALAYMFIGRRFRVSHDRIRDGKVWVLASVLVLLLIIVLNQVLIQSLPASVSAAMFFYDLLCSLLSLLVLLLVSANDRLQADLLLLRQMDRLKREHYELSKETIDLINVKCHDFRKSVASLYARDGVPPSAAAVRKAEDSLRVYDAIFQTGNEALDVILTEKSLYCSAHGITLSCMADGRALGFLDDSDQYSLFGNILDNAIEAVEHLDDVDQRVVDITVKTAGGMLSIEERNFYQGELSFEDGLPVTTKGDRRYHGFGMRSIADQVRRHQGQMTVRAQDGVFELSIVLPLP